MAADVDCILHCGRFQLNVKPKIYNTVIFLFIPAHPGYLFLNQSALSLQHHLFFKD
jgi:hypothetical protein